MPMEDSTPQSHRVAASDDLEVAAYLEIAQEKGGQQPQAEPEHRLAPEAVLVVDFGSQYSRLIARRIRQSRVYCEIISHDATWEDVAHLSPKGVILSGGPASVYEPGAPITEKDVQVLAPVEPSKIVAVGLNYRDHAKEMNKPLPEEPLLFLKPSTAVIGPSDSIVVPVGVGRVDHEAELGVVIRRRAHRVTPDRARDYILGLTCVNDVTARELQARDIQYTRAKGFDTFAPIGPGIAVGQKPDTLDVEGWVNGVRRQASNTRELIFGIDRLVAFKTDIEYVRRTFRGDFSIRVENNQVLFIT